ncbi:la-related protein 6C-like [Vicia villosa]|uniref:la-related protein 6C-like n=1 Tax=Vicia villosa TaxID=3911 RepID=UPI00273B0EEF|nr:la-related protein 6C-like [Vicia villosa]
MVPNGYAKKDFMANESFQKQMNKDPEGYVPITVIASTKKIKSLVSNIPLLTQAIRQSSKLVLSADSKKVERKHPFTEKEKEELQSRIVVAENLPDDHSHQNLQKIFSVVGSVKTIRICHPQEPNSSRPKGDFLISNKLHALVEYETSDLADKAAEKLNDERNWRKGMRVRLLLRCSPKSVLKNRKSEFDGYLDEDENLNSETAEDSSHPNNTEVCAENNVEGPKFPEEMLVTLQRVVNDYFCLVDSINAFNPRIQALSDEQLAAKTGDFCLRLGRGEILADIQAEEFTVVQDAAIRKLGMRHFDVQLQHLTKKYLVLMPMMYFFHGIEELLSQYREWVPQLQLSSI